MRAPGRILLSLALSTPEEMRYDWQDPGERSSLRSKPIINQWKEKAGLFGFCLFYLFPSVIINSEINSLP